MTDNKDDKQPLESQSQKDGSKPRRSTRLQNKTENGGRDSPVKRTNDEERVGRSTRSKKSTLAEDSETSSTTSTSSATTSITGATNNEATSTKATTSTTSTSATANTNTPPTSTSTTANSYTATRTSRASANARSSASSPLPVFSFSIGFGPMPSSLSSSLSSATFITSTTNPRDLPPEVQQMIENMTAEMRRTASAGSDINVSTSGPTGEGLIELARQMFQIIARGRSGTNSNNSSTESPQTSQEFLTMTDDLETLLNDFFTRMFEGANSTAPAGLPAERIAQLPETKDQTEIDCSICRETAAVTEEKCVELPCKHSFHFECIEPWLKRVPSCPICRKVVE